MKRLTGTALAIAGALFLVQGAQAQNTTFATGDLLMGFTQVGNTNELVFDLGNVTTLTNGETWNLGADLTRVLGSGWSTDANVQWGAVAANAATLGSGLSLGYNGNTLWVTTDSNASAPSVLSQSSQGSIRQNESNTSNAWKNQTINTTYANGLEQASNGSSSWTTLAVGNGSSSFGLSYSVESSFANGADGTVLDLYRLEPSNSSTHRPALETLVGEFTIDDSGLATFELADTVSTPEPSTYALIGVAGLLFLAARRRLLVQA